jgi:hypothetical protein
MHHVVEATLQLREPPDRETGCDAKVALVHGNGHRIRPQHHSPGQGTTFLKRRLLKMAENKTYEKPLPDFRPETKPYWDACKRHELVIPRSKTTGEFFFYPRAISPGNDMSEDIEWVKASGKAKVWTFSIHYMGPTKAYKNDPLCGCPRGNLRRGPNDDQYR